jgi:hypothetical protein
MVKQVPEGGLLKDGVQDYIAILNQVSKLLAARRTRKMMQKVVELEIVDDMVSLLVPFHQHHSFKRGYRWE